MRLYKALLGSAFLLFTSASASFGAAITFNLDCVLSSSACTGFPQTFGTVTIADTATDQVTVTVDTALGGKFKDLYLNLNTFTGTLDLPSIFSPDGFQLVPFGGLFDVGISVDPDKGFTGADGATFVLSGAGLSADLFNGLDSTGQVAVGIHLQEINCGESTCESGGNSIKVGGHVVPGDPGGDDPGVPEPSTYAIVGGGLMSIYCLRRKKA